MPSEQLVEYIKKSRGENVSDDEIRSKLADVGWSNENITKAFLLIDSPGIPMPVPAVTSAPEARPALTVNHSMWDAFEHILLFISLYVMAFAITLLLNSYINYYFPETKSNTYSVTSYNGGLILGSMAALIVSFPLFAAFFLHLGKRTREHPDLRNLKSRKFFIYLTLISTFITLISYGIGVVYGFLTGNITLNFVLQCAATLLVCGTIFGYYLSQIKEDRILHA